MRSKMLTAALCALILGSAATRADARWWSANGAACVPGDPAIQENRYTVGAGSVKHQPGASGLITLYCAVNPGIWGLDLHIDPTYGPLYYPGCSGYRMRQTYTDSDAGRTDVYVKSLLLRMSKTNGAIAPIAGASIHSNAYPETVSTNHWGAFDHAFDFQNNYYYVRVDLDRVAGSAETAIFYGVAIECR